jgi:hypothetical protein
MDEPVGRQGRSCAAFTMDTSPYNEEGPPAGGDRQPTPGGNGTRALIGKHDEQRVCMRYRHAPEKHKRYKTVELIVE